MENRNTVTFHNIFGRQEINIDLFSAISGILSTIVAIVALIIGLWQFNLTYDKTEEQINFLKKETIERNAENRPIIRVKTFNITKTDNTWKYNAVLVNDGKRQGDSLMVSEYILSYDGAESLSDSFIVPVYSSKTVRGIGLYTTEEMPFSKQFERIYLDTYLLRLEIKYRDIVSKEPYATTMFYRIDNRHTPTKITWYYEEMKHSLPIKHKEFHQIFDLYFPTNSEG